MAGTTRSSDFPVKAALQPRIKGLACGPPPGHPCLDNYVTGIDENGQALEFSTYLGGSKSDRNGGIAVDKNRLVYLTGSTLSTDFPTVKAVQKQLGNSSCTDEEPTEECDDAFVAVLAPRATAIRAGTYLGGNAEDQGLGIAVDAKGVIHVAGSTDSKRFPLADAPQAKLAGSIDGFVARYAPGATRLVLSTYVGGKQDERISGIAADSAGASLLTGRTNSANFPLASPAQGALAGDIDAFVAKLR